MTHRRLLPVLALLPVLLLGTAAPALADNAGTIASSLRNDPVYEPQDIDLVDKGAVEDQLRNGKPKVYVAVLPAADASSVTQAEARANDIGRALQDTDAVVLVIVNSQPPHLAAAEGKGARSHGVEAGAALSDELASFRSQNKAFTKDNVTAFIGSFEEAVTNQASGSSSADGNGGNGGGGPVQSTGSGSHTGAYLLGGLVLLGGGGVLLARRSSANRKKRQNDGLRADVVQLYDRLGSDVSTLDAKGDPVAQQALADAAERYNACGGALATAASPAEFAAARRSAVEGLTAARTARTTLGLDPGPEIPLPPGSGPQLSGDERVRFQDQDYDGVSSYRPGYQHYYGGGMLNGQMVPGGWYSQPFWTPFLLGSMLGGGFGGGGLFGGGYGYGGGGGYESGYEEGREDARDDSRQDNGGGGGDW